jgi:hypothetical protein
MRGRSRKFDSDGVCGKQVLVLTCDFERLIVNADRLFPGAMLSKSRPKSGRKKLTQHDQLLELLTDPDAPDELPADDIADIWAPPGSLQGTKRRPRALFENDEKSITNFLSASQGYLTYSDRASLSLR